ncbi:Matrix metalloproteinase-19 [Manis javanica]|nr:Matrix metalloproteinase-19 [Manis javanica]
MNPGQTQPWSLEMTLHSRAGAELGTTDSFKLPEISGQKHRWPLELLPGGTMSWQLLWLGFLLPMVVSARALGPAEKEAAVDYLLQYGYLQKPLEGPADFRPEDILEALRQEEPRDRG